MNILIITSVPTSRPLWCSCQTLRRSRWCLRSSSAGIAPSWNDAGCPEKYQFERVKNKKGRLGLHNGNTLMTQLDNWTLCRKYSSSHQNIKLLPSFGKVDFSIDQVGISNLNKSQVLEDGDVKIDWHWCWGTFGVWMYKIQNTKCKKIQYRYYPHLEDEADVWDTRWGGLRKCEPSNRAVDRDFF